MKTRILILISLVISVFANATDLPVKNVSGTIYGNVSWDADTVYLVTGNITIDVNATLTIPASTVIKFVNKSYSEYNFTVNGRLDCKGTTENPVIFTSDRDDSYGGDSNGDGNASIASKGDWGYIKFNSQANITPLPFENCILRYGGKYDYASGSSYTQYDRFYQIWINSSNENYEDVTIRNCKIENSYSTAIRIEGHAQPTIENNTINDSKIAIHSVGTSPLINSNNVLNNIDGIVSEGTSTSPAKPLIQNNTVQNNSGYPLGQYGNAFPSYSGNTISNNSKQVVAVKGTIDNDNKVTETWVNIENLNLPYLVTGNISIGTNMTLTIPASTVIKFVNKSYSEYNFTVNGRLDCKGTTENPVIFTSDRDDSYGGDSNGDGNASIASKGDWGYIKFNSQANITPLPFENCILRYGGKYDYASGSSYTQYDRFYQIWINSSNENYEDVTIRNCKIENSYSTAIRIEGHAQPTIENNTINDSKIAIHSVGTSPLINSNNVLNNIDGIVSEGTSTSPAKPLIQNNTVQNNSGYPLGQYGNAFPSYSGNTISNNSKQVVAVKGTIDNDNKVTETWVNIENLNLPYLVTGNISIGTNMTLTIPASTVIKFVNKSYSEYNFTVNGRLDCKGTTENPVIFTSDRDDSYGGDSNGDGNASIASKGDWGYIKFNSQANITPLPFENCILRYGGKYDYASGSSYTQYDRFYQIWINSSNENYEDVTIRNCKIENSYSTAIRIEGHAQPTIENNTINDSKIAIHSVGTSPLINSNNVLNNIDGIVSEGTSTSPAKPLIQNNTVQNNSGYPLGQYGNAFPSYSGNTISNNSKQVVAVKGTIDNDNKVTETWVNIENLNLPYLVTGNISIGTNMTLTIPASTVIKFVNKSYSEYNFTVNGRLDCKGTTENPVIFTSDRDDSYGGDSNGDGNASIASKGDWGYIKFNSQANITPLPFENCILRYGGKYDYASGSSYTQYDRFYQIWINSSNENYEDVTIRNCKIENSYSTAIRIEGHAQPTIENNTINDSKIAIHSVGTSPLINSNNVLNNIDGIVSEGTSTSPAKPLIQNNTVQNNSGYPLGQYGNAFPSYSGNTISNNSKQVVAVKGTIDNDNKVTETWVNIENLNLPYLVTGNISIGTNMTLTIPASTVIKFVNKSYSEYNFTVNGRLDCKGTTENPVIFTSDRDDSYGGDSNGDGNASIASKGDWGYIKFNSQANITPLPFENCILRYGGKYDYASGSSYTQYDRFYQIWINSSNENYEDVTIRNCKIHHFYNTGIFCSNPQKPQTISNIQFLGGHTGIHIQNTSKSPAATITDCYFTEMSSKGIYAENSALVMRDNTFFNNTNGVYINGDEAQDIRYSLFADNSEAGVFVNGSNGEPEILINNSTFKDNTAYHIRAESFANANANYINAENNHFDETDSASIAEKIYDYNDNTGSPHIDFTPFLQAGDINPYCIADFDFSGRVDGFDLALLANSFGYSKGHEFFNGTVDIDGSERIDGLDLAYFGLRYGAEGPCEKPNVLKSAFVYQSPNVNISSEVLTESKYRIVISAESFDRVFGGNIELSFGNVDYKIESISFNNSSVNDKNITKLIRQNKEDVQIGFYSNKSFANGEFIELVVSSESFVDVSISEIQLIDNNENLLLNSVTDLDNIESKNNLIKVYPNPFNDEINIQVASKVSGSIILYDVSGAKIDELPVYDNSNITYNGYNLKAGIYFIKFHSDKTIETIRIIKK